MFDRLTKIRRLNHLPLDTFIVGVLVFLVVCLFLISGLFQRHIEVLLDSGAKTGSLPL